MIEVSRSMLLATPLHRMSFSEFLDLQRKYFLNVCNGKAKGYILFVEHNPVITFGRTLENARKEMNDLLVTPLALKDRGIDLAHCNRGGGVTYHGPGQLMIYPIINLKKYRIKVSNYLSILNKTILTVLGKFGLKGEIFENEAGIKVKGSEICAIGIHVSKSVTTHGAALYVCGDMKPFKLINPCGIPCKKVTTIEKEIGRPVSLEEIYPVVLKVLKSFLEIGKDINLDRGRSGDI